jgi:hypothetical protein
MTDTAFTTFLLDSGKGVNDLGLYNDCVNTTTNRYFLLSVSPAFNPMIHVELGMCVPIQCTVKFFNGTRAYIIQKIQELLNLTVTEDMILFIDTQQINKDYSKITPKRYLAIAVLGLLFILTLVGLAFDTRPTSLGANILACFSLRKNATAILYSENRVDKNLDALNGVRVLSIAWVILGHSFVMTITVPILNAQELFTDLTSKTFMATITSATLAVDTFFCLSGFLAAFSLTQQFGNKKNVNAKTIIMAIVKRLIRLYPIYIALFIIGYNILPLIGSGPVYNKSADFINNCDKHWYYNILFIDNFEKAADMCFSWTWYLANDMQFFIILIPICILYNKSKCTAIIVSSVLIFGSHLSTFLITFINKYPVFTMTNYNIILEAYDIIYYKPWCRISTYLIGALFGWLYLSFKNEKYDTGFTKSVNIAWASNRLLRYILYVIGFGIVYFMVYSYAYFYIHPEIAEIWSVLYYTFSRSLFTIGLMMIIYPITIGRAKPLLAFLGHSLFNAMAKMTYAVYQLHLMVFPSYFLSTIQGMEYSVLFLFTRAIDGFIVSYFVGFIFTLIFESPIVQLEKLFLTPPRNKSLTETAKPVANKDDEMGNLNDENKGINQSIANTTNP